MEDQGDRNAIPLLEVQHGSKLEIGGHEGCGGAFLYEMTKGLYKRWAPGWAKGVITSFLRAERFDLPALILSPEGERTLVLAPHMDDEVLGCGGTLRRHLLAGARVTVVYMTDGRRGNPDLYHQGLTKKAIAEAEAALVVQRKGEAMRAAKILGIQEQIFLDYPDGQLETSPKLVERLRRILQEERPMVIYLPSVMDFHRDHWATNRVFYAAAQDLFSLKDWTPICRGYEVWALLQVNRVVDIGDVVEIKREALEQFQSQNARIDYVRAFLGLNAYRSIYHFRGQGYAEAFFEGTLAEYGRLFRRLLEKR